jgi:hypothetical protein
MQARPVWHDCVIYRVGMARPEGFELRNADAFSSVSLELIEAYPAQADEPTPVTGSRRAIIWWHEN